MSALRASHLGSSSTASDLLYSGFFLPSRSRFPAVALDLVVLGPLLPPRGLSHVRSSPLVLDPLHLGTLPLPRSCTHLGVSALLPGLARLGFVFAPLVMDPVHLDPFLSPRSLMHLGVTMLVLNFLHPDVSPSPQSSVCPEPVALVSGVGPTEFGMS